MTLHSDHPWLLPHSRRFLQHLVDSVLNHAEYRFTAARVDAQLIRDRSQLPPDGSELSRRAGEAAGEAGQNQPQMQRDHGYGRREADRLPSPVIRPPTPGPSRR